MNELLPEAYAQLLATIARLEEHYRDMQDIEFTVEEGTLFLLQTRTAKRTAAAALRAAVEMVEEGLISKEEAVARIDPAQLDQLLHPMIDPAAEVQVVAKGPERLAGRRVRRDRLRRRHRRGSAGRRARASSSSAGRRRPTTSTGWCRRRASSPPTAASRHTPPSWHGGWGRPA